MTRPIMSTSILLPQPMTLYNVAELMMETLLSSGFVLFTIGMKNSSGGIRLLRCILVKHLRQQAPCHFGFYLSCCLQSIHDQMVLEGKSKPGFGILMFKCGSFMSNCGSSLSRTRIFKRAGITHSS
ncbi:hypothetical protein MKW98_026018 [Papaver atlanticum]|uniref:Uncharacterized protein n=1 Tax=Papaver atlanticum TaxID=357466 RepID=A0AAD4RXW7_9MAGN|nr:hypothetical protein MKW98_026018 [Papaver atlanticum]